MSTRAWYEYHVLDPAARTRTLGMQFYKWGDATPGNALCEWRQLNDQLSASEGPLPIVWLDRMLREQLGELHQSLPSHFAVAAFVFLIQRAHEAQNPFLHSRYRHLEEHRRPDYRLGFAAGKAMAMNNFEPRRHDDPILDLVLSFIAIGHFVRPWRQYGLNWRVVEWLQYLTQPTQQVEMGSIAGDLSPPYGDFSYRYRFFIELDPAEEWRIDRLTLELCDHAGVNLLDGDPPGPTADEYDRMEYETTLELRARIDAEGIRTRRLDEVEQTYTAEPDRFWSPSNHELPPIDGALAKDPRRLGG